MEQADTLNLCCLKLKGRILGKVHRYIYELIINFLQLLHFKWLLVLSYVGLSQCSNQKKSVY